MDSTFILTFESNEYVFTNKTDAITAFSACNFLNDGKKIVQLIERTTKTFVDEKVLFSTKQQRTIKDFDIPKRCWDQWYSNEYYHDTIYAHFTNDVYDGWMSNKADPPGLWLKKYKYDAKNIPGYVLLRIQPSTKIAEQYNPDNDSWSRLA